MLDLRFLPVTCTALALLALGATPAQAAGAPSVSELKVIARFNAERAKRGLKPVLPSPELCDFARAEAELATTDVAKARDYKGRLEATGLVGDGYSAMHLAAATVDELIARLLGDAKFDQRVRQDLQAIGIGLVEVPATPPFVQAMLVLAKAAYVDPCGGGPGLSAATVERVKQQATAKVQACFDEELKSDPNRRGMLTYSIVVGPDGKVASKTRVKVDGPVAGVTPCAEAAIDALVFPKPCGDKPVSIAAFGWTLAPAHGEKQIGSLSEAQITGAIQRKRPALKTCYEPHMKAALKQGRELRGTITLHFVVEGTGKVREMTVAKDTLAQPQVLDCVLQVMRGVMFPAPKYKGEVAFDFPLDFEPDAETLESWRKAKANQDGDGQAPPPP